MPKEKDRLSPQALSVEDGAWVLAAVGGGDVTVEMIRADIEAGAPTLSDGRINLVHCAAWLVREMGRGEEAMAGGVAGTISVGAADARDRVAEHGQALGGNGC